MVKVRVGLMVGLMRMVWNGEGEGGSDEDGVEW